MRAPAVAGNHNRGPDWGIVDRFLEAAIHNAVHADQTAHQFIGADIWRLVRWPNVALEIGCDGRIGVPLIYNRRFIANVEVAVGRVQQPRRYGRYNRVGSGDCANNGRAHLPLVIVIIHIRRAAVGKNGRAIRRLIALENHAAHHRTALIRIEAAAGQHGRIANHRQMQIG